jgi:hypothetical protein
MHARVISDDESTFEVPPLSFILAAGGVDSIRTSEMPMETFEHAWATETVPLAEYQTDS